MIESRRAFGKMLLALPLTGVGSNAAAAGAKDAGGRPQAPLLSEAERQSSMCSPSNPSGVGLFGEYFGQAGLRGAPVLTRVDGVIDFDASLDWPASNPVPRAGSVRWTGWLRTPISGRYRFHLDAADSHVSISRQVLAENGASAEGIDLTAGRYYPIAISIERLPSSFSSARLEWTAPYGARYVVPKALLYLPTDAVTRPT